MQNGKVVKDRSWPGKMIRFAPSNSHRITNILNRIGNFFNMKVFSIFLLICFLGLVTYRLSKKEEIPSITPAASFALTNTELATLENKAKTGDFEAAEKLANYYSYGAVDLSYEEREAKTFYWWEFMAEWGHIQAVKNLISLEVGRQNFTHAQFWLERLEQLAPNDKEIIENRDMIEKEKARIEKENTDT